MIVIPVYIVYGETMVAQSILNGNAFPNEHHKIVDYASKRLARFFYSKKRLKSDLNQCANSFFSHLKRNWTSYKKTAQDQKLKQIIFHSESLEYLSSIHFSLYELKSFLDIYAYLVCKSLPSKEKSVNFSGEKYGNEKLSGGSFFNWINNISEKKYPERNKIIEIFVTNSRDWITNAIKLRDDAAHTKEIKNIQHMRINVSKAPQKLKQRYIVFPTINKEKPLEEFIDELIQKTGLLVYETVSLLPDIDKSKLTTWDDAKKYFKI